MGIATLPEFCHHLAPDLPHCRVRLLPSLDAGPGHPVGLASCKGCSSSTSPSSPPFLGPTAPTSPTDP